MRTKVPLLLILLEQSIYDSKYGHQRYELSWVDSFIGVDSFILKLVLSRIVPRQSWCIQPSGSVHFYRTWRKQSTKMFFFCFGQDFCRKTRNWMTRWSVLITQVSSCDIPVDCSIIKSEKYSKTSAPQLSDFLVSISSLWVTGIQKLGSANGGEGGGNHREYSRECVRDTQSLIMFRLILPFLRLLLLTSTKQINK